MGRTQENGLKKETSVWRPDEKEQPTGTQERTRHVYDYRVVLERGESTRGMKLPLELYGTDGQAAGGAWVLLEANIVPLQDAPVADPTPRAMNRPRGLLSRNVRHTDLVS